MIRTLLTLVLLCGWAGNASARAFVYVSVAGENRIAVYQLDEDSGELEAVGEVKCSGGPGSLAVDPSGLYLFASIRSVGNLASFRIADDGQLSLVSEVPAGADPSYVATNKSGKYLLSAYYRAGKVSVHKIADNGTLSADPVQTIPTDEKAHAVVRDPSGRFVFVPHTGPNAIFQFRFDEQTGRLTANDPPKVIRPESSGPRHLWFHPRKPFAYSSDEQGSSVTAYQFDPSAGQLTATQTVSSLPDDFDGRNSTSDIEVDPSGKYVYVANRGHDSIARYRVDQESGKVNHLGNTPTETTTRSFNIGPSGRYLIAAGQKSGKLATFRIGDDEALDRVGTTDVGPSPWWVLILKR